MPSAMSKPKEPVEMTAMSLIKPPSPSFMIDPLPNCFSIWLTARSIAFCRFTSMASLLCQAFGSLQNEDCKSRRLASYLSNLQQNDFNNVYRAKTPRSQRSCFGFRTWRALRLCASQRFSDSVIQISIENFKYLWLDFRIFTPYSIHFFKLGRLKC